LDENFNWLVINEFLEIAVSVLVIQNKYSFKQDDYIKIRQIVNGVNTNTSEKIKLLKDITSEEFKDLDNLFIKFENNGIEEVVFSLITHNVFDKEYLKEILKERNNQLSIYETKKILPNTWFKLHADFSYKKTDFQEEVKNIILENKNDIHFVIDIGSFHNYIQELNIGVDITQQDIDDIIKQYIDDFINKEISISIHEEYKLEVINEHYPHLVAYLENERKKVLVNGLTSEKANELIKKVTSGYGSKDEFILENISVIQFQTFILENPEFVRNLTTFVSGSISHSNSFMIAIRKIKNALANLKVMNSDYSYKVDTFLRETSIGLDYIIYNISTKPPVGSEKLSCIKI
jgi:predicted nucleic acid-binding protein